HSSNIKLGIFLHSRIFLFVCLFWQNTNCRKIKIWDCLALPSGVNKVGSKGRTKIIDQLKEDALQHKIKEKTLLKHVTFKRQTKLHTSWCCFWSSHSHHTLRIQRIYSNQKRCTIIINLLQ
ncbi:hypothetical protein V8G54_027794, partial [Vigna mungo]